MKKIDRYSSFIDEAITKRAGQFPLTRHRTQAQLWEESKMIPGARSHMGAEGIAQFMPATWREWAPRVGFPDAPATDPRAACHASVAYMADLYEQWWWPRPEADRWALALASYNAGLDNLLAAQRLSGGASSYADIIQSLERVTGAHASETKTYVRRIFRYWSCLVIGEF
jgi:membrane-bound lytic murein transglycosylase F